MKALQYGLGPFFGGVLFSIGLGVSGMTEASNILGFLDVLGNWQGELLFVMGGAVVVYAILYRMIVKRPKPLFGEAFSLPTRVDLDKRLIIGALLFGIGWGVTGLCPGPGLASLISGEPHSAVFVVTMVVGMLLGRSKFGQNLFTEAKN